MSGQKRVAAPSENDIPTQSEIAEDPDTWVPSEEEWARAKPLAEADPELFTWLTRDGIRTNKADTPRRMTKRESR